MDGLFQEKKHAEQLAKEFTALYTNGPAGGGGIWYTFSNLISIVSTLQCAKN